jgi:hypothetical protein
MFIRHKTGKAKSAEVAYTWGNVSYKKNTTISVWYKLMNPGVPRKFIMIFSLIQQNCDN